MNEEQRALVNYHMERAREAIAEAKVLFDSGHVNAYVNRLYYACFYASSSLLLTKGFSTSKHGYLRSLVHRELVKTGLIREELGKHFDLLFDSRQAGDYADFAHFEADEVAPWLGETEGFVECIAQLLLAQ